MHKSLKSQIGRIADPTPINHIIKEQKSTNIGEINNKKDFFIFSVPLLIQRIWQ